MRAALVGSQRIYLADDDGARRSPASAAPTRSRAADRADSGVVTDDMRRLLRHLLALAGRRVAGAHPRADVDRRQTARRELPGDPESGARRFSFRNVVRQRLQRRRMRRPPASRLRGGPPPRPGGRDRQHAARKAMSVLPDPVGAAISTWRPDLIAGHASACAEVGAGKCAPNQAATAG